MDKIQDILAEMGARTLMGRISAANFYGNGGKELSVI